MLQWLRRGRRMFANGRFPKFYISFNFWSFLWRLLWVCWCMPELGTMIRVYLCFTLVPPTVFVEVWSRCHCHAMHGALCVTLCMFSCFLSIFIFFKWRWISEVKKTSYRGFHFRISGLSNVGNCVAYANGNNGQYLWTLTTFWQLDS